MRKDFIRHFGEYDIPMVAIFDGEDIETEAEVVKRIRSGREMFADMVIMPSDTFDRVFRSLKGQPAAKPDAAAPLTENAILQWVRQSEDWKTLLMLKNAVKDRIEELKEERETNICHLCGFEAPWETSDDIHGPIWVCEYCGEEFCTKCFVDRYGRDAYDHMVKDSDMVLCPDCYEKAKKAK